MKLHARAFFNKIIRSGEKKLEMIALSMWKNLPHEMQLKPGTRLGQQHPAVKIHHEFGKYVFFKKKKKKERSHLFCTMSNITNQEKYLC